jgi:drug/metabolite transporter (DMT)-like permease
MSPEDQDPQDSENVSVSAQEISLTSATNVNVNGDGELELHSYYEGMNVSSEMMPLVSNHHDESTGTSISDTSDSDTRDSLSLFGIPARSVVLLNFVAVIWGTQHSVVKMVVDGTGTSDSTSSAAAFTLARFAIAALVASPFTPNVLPFLQTVRDKVLGESQADTSTTITNLDNQGDSTNLDNTDNLDNSNNDNVLAWRWGLEMGCWMFLGYAFQAVGLESTTATKSGFILYLNVKFVPFFAKILFGRRISVPTWISAATALTGTALLTIGDDLAKGGSAGAGILQSFNVGDAWSLAAAAASALFILRLESASNAVKDSSALNAASLWVVTTLSLLWTLWDAASRGSGRGGGIGMAFYSIVQSISLLIQSHGWQLVYLGAVTTSLANYLQTTGQRGMSAERAAVIYAMDPVYGALFAHWLLGENLSGAYGYAGAALITVAAATNAFLDFGSKSTKAKSNSETAAINANNAAAATPNEDATEER